MEFRGKSGYKTGKNQVRRDRIKKHKKREAKTEPLTLQNLEVGRRVNKSLRRSIRCVSEF